LARLPVEPKNANFVVVVAHPLCHFSQNAISAIAADPELSAGLKQAIWLAPPDGNLRLDVFRNWNRIHPLQRMAIAYTKTEWPSIDSWETPTFYFFRKGELVGKVAGWPVSGHSQELREQLRKLE
jgi:hypothetical protein